ncbi:MAG: GNAT family N-acetyltransferase, partial [Sphingomicrobium sp.]
MQAPVVETERLRMRPFRKDDFRPYHALLRHPEVHKHFGPNPMGEEECWRRVAASIGMWDLLGFGGWAVERSADGILIGTVSLFNA